MRKPNFFIIGAPKCGTTSLAAYLGAHANIFISDPKEPWFFCNDYTFRGVQSWEDYFKLFSEATDDHALIGEASTCYLHSSVAVQEILKFNSSAKFIVMLRNPVDMAYSLHRELVWSGDEDVKDFEKAWHLQHSRKAGANLPPYSRQPEVLQYSRVCMLGEQMQRLFNRVPRERVHVVVYDDFCENARRVYTQTLDFLGANDDGRSEFAVYNVSKKPRSQRVTGALKRMYAFKAKLESSLGIQTRLGILNRLSRANTKEEARAPLSPPLRDMLCRAFSDDVRKLSELIKRDLTPWIAGSQCAEMGAQAQGSQQSGMSSAL